MFKKFFRKKLKFFIALFVALIISLIFSIFFDLFSSSKITLFLQTMEANVESAHYFFSSIINKTYKGDFSSKRKKMSDFVIIAIDDSSFKKYGSWPFNRKIWADFLDHLNKMENPPMVFFDIIFAERSAFPESDEALIKAFKDYRGVLVEDLIFDTFSTSVGKEIEDVDFLAKKLSIEGGDYFSDKIQSIKRFELNFGKKLPISSYAKVTPMMKELAESVDISGSANVDLTINPITKLPLIVSSYFYIHSGENIEITNIYYPSIVIAMAAKLLDCNLTNLVLTADKIILKNAFYNNRRLNFEIPVDDSLRLKINYKSYPGSGFIRIVPFSKYEEYNFSSNDVLFVGMYSLKGAYDIKQTPFGMMYGIEVNAYALGTILNRDFIIEKKDFLLDTIYLFVFDYFIGFLVCFGIGFAIISLVLTIVLPLLLGLIAFLNSYSIITLLPIITGVVSLAIMQVYMLLTEEKEKKWIKSIFSSYVNPKLVDILLQNPDRVKLGGEEREVTVFFSAIKNLEEISEKLSAEKMVEFLNNYFSKMAEIVINTDGTLDKYIGDSVMAFWGAPIPIEDHQYKACEASLKMLAAVDELNKELTKSGLPPLNLTIGINSGIVVVGNVGSEQQKNYTAIGDTVNLASRVKGLNKYFHTHIIISETTNEVVKERIISRELDLTRVKGKTKPVRVYELIDLKT
ncbi:MAG: adenylate/guanylate cyclase domain-containing protein [Brevinematia bacterium]